MKTSWLVIGIVILSAGCELLNNDSSSKVVSVTLSPVNSSGQTGTAILSDLGDSKTQIAITTSGGTDTGVQSAVLRKGTCGSNGDIYAQLNNLQGRQSITTLSYSFSSLTGDKYYIDVHSSTNVDEIVSCGSID